MFYWSPVRLKVSVRREHLGIWYGSCVVSFSKGIVKSEPLGDYTVTKLVEIVLVFVVDHIWKTGEKLENCPVCGHAHSLKSQVARSLRYSIVQVLRIHNFAQLSCVRCFSLAQAELTESIPLGCAKPDYSFNTRLKSGTSFVVCAVRFFVVTRSAFRRVHW